MNSIKYTIGDPTDTTNSAYELEVTSQFADHIKVNSEFFLESELPILTKIINLLDDAYKIGDTCDLVKFDKLFKKYKPIFEYDEEYDVESLYTSLVEYDPNCGCHGYIDGYKVFWHDEKGIKYHVILEKTKTKKL